MKQLLKNIWSFVKGVVQILNFKLDKRTLFNCIKFPFVICIRVPIVSLYLFLDYLADIGFIDKLPAWDSREQIKLTSPRQKD